jgi:hypothetical protein
MTRQFERLYGTSPYASVERNVASPETVAPVDYMASINPQSIANPKYDFDLAGLIARNEAAKKVTTEKFRRGEI